MVEDAGEQLRFTLLEHHDFFFDGVACDVAIDEGSVGLSDSVGAIDRLCFGRRVPRNTFLRQAFSDPLQIVRELAEHQYSVAAGCDFSELSHQFVGLRAGDRSVARVRQGRGEAELSQQGQRRQDGEAITVEIIEQTQNLLTFAIEDGVVDLSMLRVQVDLDDLFLLGWQIRGDELLGSAHQQRANSSAQSREGLGVAIVLDRPTVDVAE